MDAKSADFRSDPRLASHLRLDPELLAGFEAIDASFSTVMSLFGRVLSQFGLGRFLDILPSIGDPESLLAMSKSDYHEGVVILSMAMQLLNVVEQQETDVYRNRLAKQGRAVSGSLHDVLLQLRQAHTPWDTIINAWRELSVELVFTAHPTESRRPSLLTQLRDLFVDLYHHGIHSNPSGIAAHIETLVATGEFISTPPSVTSERDFITRMIASTLPEAVVLWIDASRNAFRDAGCPESMVPTISMFPHLRFRSWVSSDRDGHPYVTAHETRIAIRQNREMAVAVLHNAIERLVDRLTVSRHRVKVPESVQKRFPDSEEPWKDWASHLLQSIEDQPISWLLDELGEIHDTLETIGAQFMAERVNHAIAIVHIFGKHLVYQDLRQNSNVYTTAVDRLVAAIDPSTHFQLMSDADRCAFIERTVISPLPLLPGDMDVPVAAIDSVDSLRIAAESCHRGESAIGSIIVSMTRSASDLLQVLIIAREAGLLRVDDVSGGLICPIPIVPLVETAQDHANIVPILSGYLNNTIIKRSLVAIHRMSGRNGPIPVRVMCGHSDGSKDAGVFANFVLMRQTREKITSYLATQGYIPIFFEGIGGTLIRGAAPIHNVIQHSLPHGKVGGFEYTEQGQVIAQHHLVPVISAWTIDNAISGLLLHQATPRPAVEPIPDWITNDITRMSDAYQRFLTSKEFPTFFNHATPLDILEFSRMGSRPTRRTGLNTIGDLRAIPFALAQSQSRINFTGWYGVGSFFEWHNRIDPSRIFQIEKKIDQFPALHFILTNVEMALRSASKEWIISYSQLVIDPKVRDTTIRDLMDEYELTSYWLNRLFDGNFEIRRPRLKRTIDRRNTTLNVLHHLQIDGLKEWRDSGNQPEHIDYLLTIINGISNALRGTG